MLAFLELFRRLDEILSGSNPEQIDLAAMDADVEDYGYQTMQQHADNEGLGHSRQICQPTGQCIPNEFRTRQEGSMTCKQAKASKLSNRGSRCKQSGRWRERLMCFFFGISAILHVTASTAPRHSHLLSASVSYLGSPMVPFWVILRSTT